MELEKIMLSNFGGIADITVNISPGVTYLVGENGAGKTTVGLSGVWFVLKGLAQKGPDVFHGERFRFIGPKGKSAKGTLSLHDEKENIDIKVERKLLKNKTELKITASDGRELDQSFLDEIFNIFTINLLAFSQLPPREQSLALGIDTEKFDRKKQNLYIERRDAAREEKRTKIVMEGCAQKEEVLGANLDDLIKKKEEVDRKNLEAERLADFDFAERLAEIKEFNAAQIEIVETLEDNEKKITEIDQEIKALQEEKNRLAGEAKALPKAKPLKDTNIERPAPKLINTSALTEEIKEAGETNKKAAQYQEYQRAYDEYAKAFNAYERAGEKYDQNEQDRVGYIRSKKLPFRNMTIDENGGLLVDNRPFCTPYFSTGEIMDMSANLMTTKEKENGLKYIFIPGLQNLDEKRQSALLKKLKDRGYKIMAEIVNTEKIGDNSILLREGKVVDSYEKEEKGEEL